VLESESLFQGAWGFAAVQKLTARGEWRMFFGRALKIAKASSKIKGKEIRLLPASHDPKISKNFRPNPKFISFFLQKTKTKNKRKRREEEKREDIGCDIDRSWGMRGRRGFLSL